VDIIAVGVVSYIYVNKSLKLTMSVETAGRPRRHFAGVPLRGPGSQS